MDQVRGTAEPMDTLQVTPPAARPPCWRRLTWCWLPLFVGAGSLLATLVLWQALRSQEHRHLQQMVAAAATEVHHEIVARLEARVLALVHLARHWEQWGQPTQEEWAFRAALQIEHFPGYQAIGWIDPAWRLRWLVPLAGNEAALGLDAAADPRRRLALEAAQDQRAVTATRPFTLAQGGTGFAVYVPLYPSAGFTGVIGGAFQAQALFDALLSDLESDYGLMLMVGEEELYRRAPVAASAPARWQQERTFIVHGVPWRLQVWPLPGVLAQARTVLPDVVLGGGASLSALLALVVALLQRTCQLNRTLDQRVQERTGALAATNEALHESELRLQLALDSASIGIHEWHPVTGTLHWDDCVRAHWGLAPGTPTSYDVFMAGIHPDDRAAVQAAIEHALDPQGAGRYAAEYRVIGAEDGVERWIAVTGQVFFAGGRAVRLVGTTLDLSAHKRAEVALQAFTTTLEQRVAERTAALEQAMVEQQRLEQEARRAEHFVLLGRLAAGVSHELRNPLGAVFLHVDLLEEELRDPSPDSPAGIAEAFAEIKTNLARVDDLVQDYLSLARVGNLQRAVQDLGAAVTTWATELQQEVAPRGVTIRPLGLADLGPVAFHTSTLRRALLNLVQNAADAMPQGGTITLAGQRTATHVQLTVQDTGGGIPAAQLTQIFEPLYTTRLGGTGLGLYIVQEIVTAHEGQITVASAEGQGTTFTLTLPRAL